VWLCDRARRITEVAQCSTLVQQLQAAYKVCKRVLKGLGRAMYMHAQRMDGCERLAGSMRCRR
jgi:hypothetical protein